jgi:hypothetical protein
MRLAILSFRKGCITVQVRANIPAPALNKMLCQLLPLPLVLFTTQILRQVFKLFV